MNHHGRSTAPYLQATHTSLHKLITPSTLHKQPLPLEIGKINILAMTKAVKLMKEYYYIPFFHLLKGVRKKGNTNVNIYFNPFDTLETVW